MQVRRVAALSVVVALWAAGILAAGRRPITDADLYAFQWVAFPQISPDGRQAAYVLATVNEKRDGYETSLWIVPTTGAAAPRRLTAGPRDTAPRWSPDARTLAFLRSPGEKEKPQIFLLSLDGGDARPLTDLPGGATAPVWSPSGKQIAFTSGTTADDLEEQRLAKEKGKAAEKTGQERRPCRHAGSLSAERRGLARFRAPGARLDGSRWRGGGRVAAREAAHVGCLHRNRSELGGRRFRGPLPLRSQPRAVLRPAGGQPLFGARGRRRDPDRRGHRGSDPRRGGLAGREVLRTDGLDQSAAGAVLHAVRRLSLHGRKSHGADHGRGIHGRQRGHRRPASTARRQPDAPCLDAGRPGASPGHDAPWAIEPRAPRRGDAQDRAADTGKSRSVLDVLDAGRVEDGARDRRPDEPRRSLCIRRCGQEAHPAHAAQRGALVEPRARDSRGDLVSELRRNEDQRLAAQAAGFRSCEEVSADPRDSRRPARGVRGRLLPRVPVDGGEGIPRPLHQSERLDDLRSGLRQRHPVQIPGRRLQATSWRASSRSFSAVTWTRRSWA